MIERMRRPSVPLSILLVVGGVAGLVAAFALTLDKIAVLEDPGAALSCDFSVLVQCGKNLSSPEGEAFGFPNPLIGLMTFPAPILIGVASLAGARFPRWIWALFNVGMAFAIGFVAWLMTQSVFTLGTLCPWCMTVWAVVIPMSLGVTLWNVREGNLPLGRRAARVAGVAFEFLPVITLACYAAFAVIAQVQLDVLRYLF